ncbi:hypothetical protein [Methylobacterium radiodurans]|uniref:Lysozyme inhibitor LprI N-terminal domain-containing protein n=1 Tax=Methylobacterium radiodurans TaxID=2202828 RepID=A0A2U8VMS1_9HYPH|nr:hypothetical protein [Methylobacterium radiodurans]AWN34840.1 hypothetical protein DK427_03040 [Methylobacterium radiodurans]
MIRSLCLAGSLMLCLAGAAEAGEAGRHYASWRGCLDRNFALQAALTSPSLAADAALRICRETETAYLAALAASPMVDADEADQARPALVARARGWLLGRRASL